MYVQQILNDAENQIAATAHHTPCPLQPPHQSHAFNTNTPYASGACNNPSGKNK